MPRPRRQIQHPRTDHRGLLSSRRALTLTPALLSLALNITIALLGAIPRPYFHDEFSYLLAADTFSHRRATNSTHPFWQHFETIHVIHQPTYASKYPPAPGLFMATGQILLGLPIAGVWLASALACAAITWALLAYLPRRWALLGGTLTAFHPLVLLWSQEYWGGVVPMLGGALVLGGARRVLRRTRLPDALLLAAGMAILANSRPYEGFAFTAIVLLVLTIPSIRARRLQWPRLLTRGLLPVLSLLALTACAMAYYNHRVTANALKLPYVVHEQQYGLTPLFLFQSPKPAPDYRHKSIEEYHARWAMPWYTSQQSLRGFFRTLFNVKLSALTSDYLARGALALPLLVALVSLRANRHLRPVALMLLLFLLALLPATWILVHYAAPAFSLLMILVVGGLRRIRRWTIARHRLGRFLLPVILAAFAFAFAARTYDVVMKSISPNHWPNFRANMTERLLESADRHLILVHYGPRRTEELHIEWVYNAADIDAAPIVWARAISPDDDRRLMDYFNDRHVHRLDVGGGRTTLAPIRPPIRQ